MSVNIIFKNFITDKNRRIKNIWRLPNSEISAHKYIQPPNISMTLNYGFRLLYCLPSPLCYILFYHNNTNTCYSTTMELKRRCYVFEMSSWTNKHSTGFDRNAKMVATAKEKNHGQHKHNLEFCVKTFCVKNQQTINYGRTVCFKCKVWLRIKVKNNNSKSRNFWQDNISNINTNSISSYVLFIE